MGIALLIRFLNNLTCRIVAIFSEFVLGSSLWAYFGNNPVSHIVRIQCAITLLIRTACLVAPSINFLN
ncbi:hypothetical protein D3C78_1760040 [compost metagenome]